jgi:hypothetical protein
MHKAHNALATPKFGRGTDLMHYDPLYCKWKKRKEKKIVPEMPNMFKTNCTSLNERIAVDFLT